MAAADVDDVADDDDGVSTPWKRRFAVHSSEQNPRARAWEHTLTRTRRRGREGAGPACFSLCLSSAAAAAARFIFSSLTLRTLVGVSSPSIIGSWCYKRGARRRRAPLSSGRRRSVSSFWFLSLLPTRCRSDYIIYLRACSQTCSSPRERGAALRAALTPCTWLFLSSSSFFSVSTPLARRV